MKASATDTSTPFSTVVTIIPHLVAVSYFMSKAERLVEMEHNHF